MNLDSIISMQHSARKSRDSSFYSFLFQNASSRDTKKEKKKSKTKIHICSAPIVNAIPKSFVENKLLK